MFDGGGSGFREAGDACHTKSRDHVEQGAELTQMEVVDRQDDFGGLRRLFGSRWKRRPEWRDGEGRTRFDGGGRRRGRAELEQIGPPRWRTVLERTGLTERERGRGRGHWQWRRAAARDVRPHRMHARRRTESTAVQVEVAEAAWSAMLDGVRRHAGPMHQPFPLRAKRTQRLSFP